MAEFRDPALDKFRRPPTDRCWWCGDKATTREHKFKHSDLRLMATADDGTQDLSNVIKKSEFYEGPLRTLKRGDEVKWGLNLCAPCNNVKSQPFDNAYHQFVRFLLANGDDLYRHDRLDWSDVYGPGWAAGAANLARYFVKQFGCMMATQQLAVPQDAVDFLNGVDRCPAIRLALWRDHRVVELHRVTRRDALPEGMLSFIGLPSTKAYTDGKDLTGADYQCRLAYRVFDVSWHAGGDTTSFHEGQVIPLPLINARLRDRVAGRPSKREG